MKQRTHGTRFMKRHTAMFAILAAGFIFSLSIMLAFTSEYISGGLLTYIDIILERWFTAGRTPSGFFLFHFFSLIAGPSVVALFALLLSIRLWRENNRRLAFFLWALLVVCQGGVLLMKTGFSRPRPLDVLPPFFESTYAFPSGHAAMVVAFYGFALYALLRSRISSTWKFLAPLAWILVVLMVDVSRMYLGVHYMTDIIVGNLFGLTCLITGIAMNEWILMRKKKA